MKHSQGNCLINGLYESPSGVLNKSVYQLSGRYKIFVDSRSNNYDLYLSDYTGYKSKIDTTKPFMNQLSEFLKNVNSINIDKTYYAGYSDSEGYYYHIPYYISKENTQIPSHTIILKVPNKDYSLNNINKLYTESSTIDVIDNDLIYLNNIFREITELELESPVRLYWRGYNNIQSVIIKGFDYVNSVITEKEISIREAVINNNSDEDELTYLSNYILEKFEDNHIIYPYYINLEYRFDYEKKYPDIDVDFQNFYAFISTSDNINLIPTELPENGKLIKTYTPKSTQSSKSILFYDIDLNDKNTTIIDKHEEVTSSTIIQEVNEQEYLMRVKPTKISINDTITIKSRTKQILSYRIKESDITSTTSIRSSMILLGKKISYMTSSIIRVDVSDDNIWYFRSSDEMEYIFKTGSRISNNYKKLDGNDVSVNITINDVISKYQIDADKLIINNESYNIIKSFNYDGKHVLRLDRNPHIKINTVASVVTNVYEKIQKFTPLPILNTYNDLYTLPLYDFNQYYSEISDTHSTYKQTYPTPKQENEQISNNADTLFVNGSNSLGSIHTLDYDSRIGLDHNCEIKYGYFLIKGENPDYVNNDYRIQRYFTDKPKMRSVLKRINTRTCETVFLGVKYSTDIRYEGYYLSVYANIDNEDEQGIYAYVDDINKTIDLVINYYLLFKGINDSKTIPIDYSIFQNIDTSFEFSNRNTDIFNRIGFRFGRRTFEVSTSSTQYNSFVVEKYNGNKTQKYFLVTRDEYSVDRFSELYNEGETVTIDYYDKVKTKNNETYREVEVVVFSISFVNLTEIRNDYFLCEDIIIKSIMGEVDGDEVKSLYLQLDDSGYYTDVSDYDITIKNPDKSDILGMYKQKVSKISKGSSYLSIWDKVFLPNYINPYSVDITKSISGNGITITPISNNTSSSEKSVIKRFDELVSSVSLASQYFSIKYSKGKRQSVDYFDKIKFQSEYGHMTDMELESKANERLHNNSFINQTKNESFTLDLFDINKFWDMVSFLCTNMKTSRMSQNSLLKYMNKFSYQSFSDILNSENLPIKNSDESLKISVISSDINDSLSGKMKRFSVDYIPYYTEFPNIIQSQLINQISQKIYKNLYTLFSENYGQFISESSTSATGLWSETHSIVSTLFVSGDISITTQINSDVFRLDEVLYNNMLIERMLINGKNESYISTKSGSVDNYIRSSYIQYILKNFYTLDKIINNYKKINFYYDNKNFRVVLDNIVSGNCQIILKRID